MADTDAIHAFIGIDPGKGGAMATLLGSDAVVTPFNKAAYTAQLRYIARGPLQPLAVVEHVGAMPGQGVTSCFSFGENFGWIQGLLDALAIPYELVRPLKWKRAFGCTSDKNTSIAVAQRLFPDVDLRRTQKCKKPHDGIAEALLMAEYARRLRA